MVLEKAKEYAQDFAGESVFLFSAFTKSKILHGLLMNCVVVLSVMDSLISTVLEYELYLYLWNVLKFLRILMEN